METRSISHRASQQHRSEMQSNKSSNSSVEQSLNEVKSQEDVELNNSNNNEASTDERTIKNQMEMLNGVSQRLISYGNFKQSQIDGELVNSGSDTAASLSNHATV